MAQQQDNPIQGRYKLYKAGTAKLVRWLANAGSCDIITTTPPIADRSNMRKARNVRPKVSSQQPIKIRTCDLTPLARAIVSSQPPVDIPEDKLILLREVIDGREVCAGWYASQTCHEDDEVAKQNTSHGHFITVLKRVQDILTEGRDNVPPEIITPIKAKRARDTEGAHGLSNIFACLEIEEPSSAPLGSKKNAPPVIPQPPVNFELEEQATDDTAFEIWCLLQDLDDMRRFVRESWEGFGKGDLSLSTVGMLTETAFAMMRRADEDFISRHPDCGTYGRLTAVWTDLLAGSGTALPATDRSLGNRPQRHPRAALEDDLLCPKAAGLLRKFSTEAQSYRKKIVAASKSDASNRLKFPPHSAPPQDSPNRFSAALLHLMPDIVVVAIEEESGQPKQRTKGYELFVRGLALITSHDVIPTWLVILCQAYMDIYDTVHRFPGVGIDYGIDTSLGICTVLDNHRQFISLSEDNEEILRVWDNQLGKVSQMNRGNARILDTVAGAGTYLYNEVFAMMRQQRMPVECLIWLPVQTSTKAYYQKGELLLNSTWHANSGYFILAAAHLYRAYRHYGLLAKPWHDMEFIIAQQSGKQEFVPKAHANADPKAILRHFNLALGMPASAYARDAKPKLPSWNTLAKNGRKIRIVSPFTEAMNTRTRERRQLESDYDDEYGDTIAVVVRSLMEKAAAKAAPQSTRPGAHSESQRFTPLSLLSTLKQCLIADEPQLNFDYVSFLQSCMDMLCDISGMGREHEETYMVGARYEIVTYLLWEASEAVIIGKSLESTVFGRAAAIVQDHVDKLGNRFTKEAYDQSSGRIPKHKRPNFTRSVEEWMADVRPPVSAQFKDEDMATRYNQ